MKQLLLTLAASLVCSTAFADRVSGSPPTDCPPGSYPSVDHGGPHCAIVRCTNDADCTRWAPDLSCGPQASICVVTDEYNTYSRRPHERERAASACVGGACSEGECETSRFCIRGAAATMNPEPTPEATEPTMDPEPTMMSTEPATSSSTEAESGCSASSASGYEGLLLLFLFRRRR